MGPIGPGTMEARSSLDLDLELMPEKVPSIYDVTIFTFALGLGLAISTISHFILEYISYCHVADLIAAISTLVTILCHHGDVEPAA